MDHSSSSLSTTNSSSYYNNLATYTVQSIIGFPRILLENYFPSGLPATYYWGLSIVSVQFPQYSDGSSYGDDEIYMATSKFIYKYSKLDGILRKLSFSGEGWYDMSSFFVLKTREGGTSIYVTSNSLESAVYLANEESGTVKLIAGSLTSSGFNGDGRPAIDSLLNKPQSVYAKDGEVYISDTNNHLIRRIDRNGTLWNVFKKEFVRYPQQLLFIGNDMVVNTENSIYRIFPNQTIESYYCFLAFSKAAVFENDIYYINYDGIQKLTGSFSSETLLNFGKSAKIPRRLIMDQQGNYLVSFGNYLTEFKRYNDTVGTVLIGTTVLTPQYYTLPANISEIENVESMTLNEEDNSIIFTQHSSSVIRQYIPNKPFMNVFGMNMEKISFISKYGNEIYAIVNNNIYLRNNEGNFTQLSGFLSPDNVPDNIKSTLSTLNSPRGIFLKKQKLYISDSNNHRIRVIDMETGIISTLAGNGIADFSGDGFLATEASLKSPSAIFVSDYERIYISDSGNHRIRVILPTGIISTIVGNGIPAFSGDNGLAINASLNKPYGIVETVSGELIIADTDNYRIRIVDLYGVITTLAGTGEKGFQDGFFLEALFNNPTQLFYSHPYLYISDTNGQRIREANLDSKNLKTIVGTGEKGFNGDNFPTTTQLNNPLSIFISNNVIYIADTDNKKIRMLNMGVVTTLDLTFQSPKGITGDSKYLYITDGDLVKKIDIHNGYTVEIIGGGIGDGWELKYAILSAQNLAIDEENVYFVDSINNVVRKFDKNNGIVSTIAGRIGTYGYYGDSGLAVEALLNFPKGLAVSKSSLGSFLYICDFENNRIRRVNLETGIITTAAGIGVKGYSGDGGLAIYAKITNPTHIAVNKEGEVFFSDYNYVRKITRSGYIFRIAGAQGSSDFNGDSHPALETYFSVTKSLMFDNTGSVVVFDYNNQLIRKLIPQCETGYTLEHETNSTCIPNCFGIYGKEITACSSQGFCKSLDQCECYSGYSGSNCSESICFGKTGAGACNGNGVCVSPNVCQCLTDYSGIDCSTPKTVLILLGSLIACGLVILIVCVVSFSLIFVYIQHQRKKRMILMTDKLIDKRLLMDDFASYNSSNGTACSELNEADFVIPLEQLDMDHPIKRIGEGSFARVFSTKWGNQLVAVKVVDMNDFDLSEETFKQEFKILSRLRHPKIVSFYGISFSPTKRYIVMELCEQSLEHVINQLQNEVIRMSLQEKIDILIDIMEGVNYLHTLTPKCLHRDLKPLNILVSFQKEYKLCDFGVGKILNAQTVNSMTNNVGTCYYIAPETTGCESLKEFETVCATSIDIYSLAIIIWQILFEVKDPYISCHDKVLKKLKMNEPLQLTNMYHLHRLVIEKNLRPTIPFSSAKECQQWCQEYLSPTDAKYHSIFYEICQLTKLCWDKQPKTRPTAKTILERLEEWKGELAHDYYH